MDKQTSKRSIRSRIRNRYAIAFLLIIFDVLAVNFSYFFALWLRFDFQFSQIPSEYLQAFVRFTPFYTIGAVVFFWAMRMYRAIWQLVGTHEFLRYIAASLVASLAHCVLITIILGRMPASYYVIGSITQCILVVGGRFSYRIFLEWRKVHSSGLSSTAARVMIIGAGKAGQMVIQELQRSTHVDETICCIIDDNSYKWDCWLEGVPIVGGRNDIFLNVQKHKIDRIYYCIPSASAATTREILNICKETGCEIRRLPGIFQLVKGELIVSQLKPVAIEDLLGRETVKVNMDEIFQYLQGKTVLVTGGGGSIGSELCRQIAEHEPKQLIIFDIYENNAYAIEQELRRKHPELDLVVLIGSVRDSRRINQVFEDYRPELVYHAAAHKHVPLMETSPNEAIKNNVVGTYKTAYAALVHGTQRFVLISTDKAVNPTNIMGASKRLCEMVVQSMDAVSKSGRVDMLPFIHAHEDKKIDGQYVPDPIDHIAVGDDETPQEVEKIKIESVKDKNRTGTQFVSVRFGNVLGSNGSVVPLFQKQIEEGGPVTVTHPDIIRYFMTIPEAVSLILQAGMYAWGGETFVLDMGEPVKIDTLARNLIKLSGYQPDDDIKIVYTGLRPGEKLFEEKLMEEEGLRKTDNDLIYIGKPIPFDVEQFLSDLEELARASYENSPDIVKMVEKMVSTFHPVGMHPTGDEMKNTETKRET